MSEASHGQPEKARPRFYEEWPGPAAWNALQGGKPRVFRNPRNPDAVWRVVHVYEQHRDPAHRFQSGIIVPTMPYHLTTEGRLQVLSKRIEIVDADGKRESRNVSFPSFMDRSVHGDMCEGQSTGNYDRIKNQEQYNSYLAGLKRAGFQELRFGVDDDGFKLTPLSGEIAPSAPLAPPAEAPHQNPAA